MKKFFAIALFLFISLTTLAQGIAIQGIARDNESSAITNTVLTYTFSITKSDNTVQYSETEGIQTDNFGVFSHIVSTGNPTNGAFNNVDFSIANLKLRVTVTYAGDEIEVYNQEFQYTPYAHFAKRAAVATNADNADRAAVATNADNADRAAVATNADDGVPTGSIIPYIGSTAPDGWVFCNGQNITSVTGSTALRDLVGNNAPDLRGTFLRGTGTSSVHGKSGPSLKATQADTFKSHAHGVAVSLTSDGNHNHKILKLPQDSGGVSGQDRAHLTTTNGSDESWQNISGSPSSAIQTAGNHSHTATGTISPTGNAETRPVNYGVNYIIKL